jgi:hypothetical protein
MRKRLGTVIFLLPLLGFSSVILAQSSSSSAAADLVTNLYLSSIGSRSPLYSGLLYSASYTVSSGSPFYAGDEPQLAALVYHHNYYPHVKLLLNIATEQLLIPDPQHRGYIVLKDEAVDSFSMNEKTFVFLGKDSLNPTAPGKGYYERIWNGSMQAFEKKSKRLVRYGRPEDNLYRFSDQTSFYAFDGESYRKLENVRDIARFMKMSTSDLNRVLREVKADFRRQPRETIIAAMRHQPEVK